MKQVFFIYSGNKRIDEEFIRGIKNWLPTEIGIKEVKIKESRLVTLDDKVIDYTPIFLRNSEKPIYLTPYAYNVLINTEKYYVSSRISDIRIARKILYELKIQQQIVAGRVALRGFIEGLKKAHPSML